MPIIRNPFSRKNANGEVLANEPRQEIDYFNRNEPPSSIEIKQPTEFKLSSKCLQHPSLRTSPVISIDRQRANSVGRNQRRGRLSTGITTPPLNKCDCNNPGSCPSFSHLQPKTAAPSGTHAPTRPGQPTPQTTAPCLAKPTTSSTCRASPLTPTGARL